MRERERSDGPRFCWVVKSSSRLTLSRFDVSANSSKLLDSRLGLITCCWSSGGCSDKLGDEAEADSGPPGLVIAVSEACRCAADGVRFVTTAACQDVLFAQLAEYVRGRCDDVLWADASKEVHRLLDDGHLRTAIALYFGRTGERWDQERLELFGVTLEHGRDWIPDEERMADVRR